VAGFEIEFELPSGNLRRAILKAQIVDCRPVDTDVPVSFFANNRASFFRAVLGKDCYDDDDFVANKLVVIIESRFLYRVLVHDADYIRVDIPNIDDRYVEHPARGQNVLADLAGAVNDDTALAKDSKVELNVLIRPTEAKEGFFGGISQLHLKPANPVDCPNQDNHRAGLGQR
jgi:hypothetical protein